MAPTVKTKSPSSFIVRNRLQGEDQKSSFRRFLPATFFSIVVHTFLLGLFMLLVPGVSEKIVLEQKVEQAVNAEPVNPQNENHFLSDDFDLRMLEPEHKIQYPTQRIESLSVPGKENPKEPVGIPDGDLKNLPKSIPAPPGFDSIPGLGGSKGEGANGTVDHNLPPGGVRGESPIKNPFPGRGGSTTEIANRPGGGTSETQAAVRGGLQWLEKQQNKDGSWNLRGKYPDKGNTENEVAATGLALLPFLGAGFTHKKLDNNPFNKPVLDAILYLLRNQDRKTGNLDKNHNSMYAHGLATIALCEAYGMTQDPKLRQPAQMALSFIMNSQHDGGGWRYSPNQTGDLSVSGWMIMALKSGQMCGLDVSMVSMSKAQRFLDSSLADSKKESYAYTPGSADGTPAMTSVALLCRQYIQGWGPKNIRLIRGVENQITPTPPGKNCYYYYYATQVMHQYGGKAWEDWNQVMRKQLIDSQIQEKSNHHGSWTSTGDTWGVHGGRLMVTSLNILTLEVYYRYLPLYYREKEAAKEGAVKNAVGS